MRVDQINICWSTAENPVALLDPEQMNKTYKERQAAEPSAISYPVSLAELQKMTSTTPGASSASTNAPSSLTSGTSPASSVAGSSQSGTQPPSSSSGGLSGGAIGGIVGGVIGGIAIIGFIVFLLWRRRNNKANNAGAYAYAPPPAELGHDRAPAEAPPMEKYAHHGPNYASEMPGQQQQRPVEMPGNMPGQHY